jgi:uncharacterized membrane protein
MMKSYGITAFALGLTGLCILSFMSGDFILGRPPDLNTSPVLAYILSGISFATALMILFRNGYGGIASFIVGALILVFSFLFRHFPAYFKATNWQSILWSINAYKTLALTGASWIVSATLFDTAADLPFKVISRSGWFQFLPTLGIIFLSVFVILSGFAHFKYFAFVKDFIPAYIPWRPFFAGFCGIALIVGGIGILIPRVRHLASYGLGIMILIWFLFLHIPRFMMNMNDASDRMGLFESFLFAGVFFVLAYFIKKNNQHSIIE